MGRWTSAEPIQYRQFIDDSAARKRYWVRSLNGFKRLVRAGPNAAHRALAELESLGIVAKLITQNVDGLHAAAGSRRVLELHGSMRNVVCLSCRSCYLRERIQAELERLNAAWLCAQSEHKPDGDAALYITDYRDIVVPACPSCGGILKPDVVLFGEAIPHERRAAASAAVRRATAVLVVGSSLMVLSGFRLVREAHAHGIELAAINLGVTRADQWFDLKLEAPCEAVLEALTQHLGQTC